MVSMRKLTRKILISFMVFLVFFYNASFNQVTRSLEIPSKPNLPMTGVEDPKVWLAVIIILAGVILLIRNLRKKD